MQTIAVILRESDNPSIEIRVRNGLLFNDKVSISSVNTSSYKALQPI